jgi:hypothetical protein
MVLDVTLLDFCRFYFDAPVVAQIRGAKIATAHIPECLVIEIESHFLLTKILVWRTAVRGKNNGLKKEFLLCSEIKY